MSVEVNLPSICSCLADAGSTGGVIACRCGGLLGPRSDSISVSDPGAIGQWAAICDPAQQSATQSLRGALGDACWYGPPATCGCDRNTPRSLDRCCACCVCHVDRLGISSCVFCVFSTADATELSSLAISAICDLICQQPRCLLYRRCCRGERESAGLGSCGRARHVLGQQEAGEVAWYRRPLKRVHRLPPHCVPRTLAAAQCRDRPGPAASGVQACSPAVVMQHVFRSAPHNAHFACN